MIPFKSPICSEHIWHLCLKTNKEIEKLYYSDTKKKEQDKEIHGIIEYINSTIYIDKNLDDVLMVKEIRKQLMRIYLYDTGIDNILYSEETFCDIASVVSPGIDNILYSEETFCDIASVVSPVICKKAEKIFSKIKNNRGGKK